MSIERFQPIRGEDMAISEMAFDAEVKKERDFDAEMHEARAKLRWHNLFIDAESVGFKDGKPDTLEAGDFNRMLIDAQDAWVYMSEPGYKSRDVENDANFTCDIKVLFPKESAALGVHRADFEQFRNNLAKSDVFTKATPPIVRAVVMSNYKIATDGRVQVPDFANIRYEFLQEHLSNVGAELEPALATYTKILYPERPRIAQYDLESIQAIIREFISARKGLGLASYIANMRILHSEYSRNMLVDTETEDFLRKNFDSAKRDAASERQVNNFISLTADLKIALSDYVRVDENGLHLEKPPPMGAELESPQPLPSLPSRLKFEQ